MASVLDVAAYILQKKGRLTTWKLQEIVYYCQAWSLVWDEEPLFEEKIHAWINGPTLYEKHKNYFSLSKVRGGNPDNLDSNRKDTINVVLDFYGDMSPQSLSNLVHMEDPLRNARKGMSPRVCGETEIPLEAMAKYYEGLSGRVQSGQNETLATIRNEEDVLS